MLGLTCHAQTTPTVTWDSLSLSINGKRVAPVMGEIHYSRVPEAEWANEIHKMKLGGITIIACYVFWNHIEEIEGQFDWSGQRNLRHFLELCKEEGLPVVLRLGPFCHGEVRGGGIPDWVITKGITVRDENPEFLACVTRLYRQIFTQVQGLQWKDGGPVIGAQFDNEFGGYSSYLLRLKKIANDIGFDLPFYTKTGWPEMKDQLPYGEMIPLFGDYADGFWDRSIQECAGYYWQGFHFRPSRANQTIGSEQIDYSKQGQHKSTEKYPYFTCELGGGMTPSYHRRVFLYPEDAYALATVKLGSGSNLLGYYMYHGGTNPEGKLTYLNEKQATPYTNYNDLPVKTYDFQAPLGEFGQVNPHFYLLRRIHRFMRDFGEVLAPMTPVFPTDAVFEKGDDSKPRWVYRHEGNRAFVFVNNYERLQNLTAKKNVRFSICGVNFPSKPMTIPAGVDAIFPVNIKVADLDIRYATAQLLAKRRLSNGKQAVYFFQVDGIPAELSLNGKRLRNVKPQGESKPIFRSANTEVYLLTSRQAALYDLDVEELEKISPKTQSVLDTQFAPVFNSSGSTSVPYVKVQEGQPRPITLGIAKAAQEPEDSDFDHAAVYDIDLSAVKDWHEGLKMLDIQYQGDVARLYVDGKFVDDNFYNGRHFQYGLWRLPASSQKLQLRILPIQKDMPIYFPSEADKSIGEKVLSITVK